MITWCNAQKSNASTCTSKYDEKDIMFTLNFHYEKNNQYLQKQNFRYNSSAWIKAIYIIALSCFDV